jgi:hypothetical protein
MALNKASISYALILMVKPVYMFGLFLFNNIFILLFF